MKNLILIVLLFVMFMGVVYGAIVATGGEHWDMTGKIVGVCTADNNSTDTNSILVQGVVTSGNQEANVTVRITNDTQLFAKNGNQRNQINFSDLKSGQSVNIQFKGPILQSYPPQASGSQVLVTG
ncbi:MAG: hypothetical protein F8N15_09390 [Methanobacterium sp.]|nr:hypothetical protein [Methanobacterium sp.]